MPGLSNDPEKRARQLAALQGGREKQARLLLGAEPKPGHEPGHTPEPGHEPGHAPEPGHEPGHTPEPGHEPGQPRVLDYGAIEPTKQREEEEEDATDGP